MSKGVLSKRVPENEIESFERGGWAKGRIVSSGSCVGKVWINRSGERKRVDSQQVERCLADNWSLGKQDKRETRKFPTRQAYADSQKLSQESLQQWKLAIDSVDTTKFGFIGKIAKKMDCSHTHVRRVLNKYFPDIQSFMRKTSSS
jgi:hypothetical protein